MITLHEILWDLNNEDLAFRLKILDLKPRSPRKADLIDALKTALQGESLKKIWTSLENLEQAAVAEVCHDASLTYNASRIKAKYGNTPSFYNSPEKERSTYYRSDPKYATRLNLFIISSRLTQGEWITPSDLAEQLRGLVPKPNELQVATIEAPVQEMGLTVRQTQHEALSEVVALLHLADQGNLSISAKTGNVSAAACRKIMDCLIDGDFFPPEIAYRPNKRSYEQEIGPIKPIAWARLLETAKYFRLSGQKSILTAAGKKALSLPAHEVIQDLWTKWLKNTKYDEFNRVDAIKGQKKKGHMTGKPERRSAILDALRECPTGEWIALDKFSDFMQGAGHEFEVSRDHWKLYLCDAHYGSLGYEGYGDWNIVQFRYILCLLFEYAATLGLIEIAYVPPRGSLRDYQGQWGADELEWLSRYDGLRSFRITDLGAYCLGLTEEFEQRLPPSGLKLTVLPSLRIRVRSGTILPAEKLKLETWAEPDEENVWKLNTERALEAVERGHRASDFAKFLTNHDDQELPETVQAFLTNCERDGKALVIQGEATLIHCRDANTAKLICAQKELQGHCHRCGETLLAVTTTQLKKFRKVARSLGLGIQQ